MFSKRLIKLSLFFIGFLFLFSVYNFIRNAHEDFLPMHYNWFRVKQLTQFEESKVDSFSYDYLRIKSNKIFNNNQHNTATIIANGKKYYFKYPYSFKEQNITTFYSVIWINGIPENLSKGDVVNYFEVDLPIRYNDGKSVLMFGDNSLTVGEGKYLRRFIKENERVSFKGQNKDIFNFSHDCVDETDLTQLITKSAMVASAEVYILSLGENSIGHRSFNEIKSELNSIIKNLEKNQPQSIILTTIPYHVNEIANEKLKIYNEYLKSLNQKKHTRTIDLNELVTRNTKFHDAYQLTMEDYRLIAKKIGKCL